jgi:hypothetical protein
MKGKLAKKAAKDFGINMDVECAWIGPPDQDGFTPFGPDQRKITSSKIYLRCCLY